MPTMFSSNLQLPFHRADRDRTTSAPRRIANIRGQASSLFNGSSVIQPRSPASSGVPKTARPRLGIQVLSSNEEPPSPPNTNVQPLRRAPSSTCSIIDPSSSPVNTIRPLTPSTFERLERSSTETRPRHPPRARTYPSRASRSLRNGVSPEELALVRIIGSRRERNRPRKGAKLRRCTFANITSPKVRSKTLSCLVSGGLLAVVLAIYLALAISNPVAGQEFHVLLILIILIVTIFFCHSLIRLSMLILRPEREQRQARLAAGRGGARGYANPETPIPVLLARDEEIAAGDNDEQIEKTVGPPPPAYGLWRSTVRMNPNLVYWQKVEGSRSPGAEFGGNPGTVQDATNRPPSYVSEDGVEYVIEAQPRSTVVDPLPVHPSERGRIDDVPPR